MRPFTAAFLVIVVLALLLAFWLYVLRVLIEAAGG